jgi:hypothetical protein
MVMANLDFFRRFFVADTSKLRIADKTLVDMGGLKPVLYFYGGPL